MSNLGRVYIVPIGIALRTFRQHPEFMVPPPVDSSAEVSWDSLLPKGLGYVKNPHIAATENISTIGAFHQLHCLVCLVFLAPLSFQLVRIQG